MTTEQELRLEVVFVELTDGFKECEKQKDAGRQEALLKELNEKIKDAKALIKEFEREARNDAMSAEELMRRKGLLVNALNNFISIKKTQTSIVNSRMELQAGPSGRMEQGPSRREMTTQHVIAKGRKEMKEIETGLGRAERVVEDTIQIGVQTAAELREQTKQMERVVEDLDDIEFTMKKARQVLMDLTRGILTDKYDTDPAPLNGVAAIVTVIVLSVLDDDDGSSLQKPKEIGVSWLSSATGLSVLRREATGGCWKTSSESEAEVT